MIYGILSQRLLDLDDILVWLNDFSRTTFSFGKLFTSYQPFYLFKSTDLMQIS